jgi:hypothetical protein
MKLQIFNHLYFCQSALPFGKPKLIVASQALLDEFHCIDTSCMGVQSRASHVVLDVAAVNDRKEFDRNHWENDIENRIRLDKNLN